MKKVLSLGLLILIIVSTIALVSCDATKVILGIFDLIKEDNTNTDLDINIGIGSEHIHRIGTLPGREATCSVTGLTEGQYCLSCDKIILEQAVIPLKAHTEVNDEAVEATCTSTGLSAGKHCSACGIVIVQQNKIPKKSHTEVVDKAIEATCSKKGLTEGKHCSMCGSVLVAQQETPMIAHTYDDEYDKTCNYCAYVRDAQCDHEETETIYGFNATCTSTGLSNGTKCKKCEEILVSQKVIQPIPHSEVIDASLEATCTSTGLTQGSHCSVCKSVIIAQVEVPIKPHEEVVDAAIEATCTSTGLTNGKHCTVCGTVTVAQEVVSVKPHSFGEWVIIKDATDTTEGIKERTCACGFAERVSISKLKENSEGLEYKLNSDKCSYSITGIGTCTDEAMVIPSEYNGMPVNKIANEAFKNCNLLTSVVIPDSITSFGHSVFFGCSSLESIVIPDSVADISINTFNYCTSLRSIYIGSLVEKLNLGIVGCDSLENIDISEDNPKYMSIDGNIYSKDGTSLIRYAPGKQDKSFTIPDNVSSIAEYAFSNSKLNQIVISSSLTDIGDNAFYGCSSLVSIDIPNTVKSIGERAFESCVSLESVKIGKSVESIEPDAFYKCVSIKEISVDEQNIYFTSKNGNLYSKDEKTLILYAIGKEDSGFSVPYGVTEVGPYAFSYSKLESVIIPKTVTEIGKYAFSNSEALKTVEMPDTILIIGGGAFGYCKSLENIALPDSLEKISGALFEHCYSLKSVVIGDCAITIGGDAFWRCESLESVIIGNSVVGIWGGAFDDCHSLKSITMPKSLLWFESIPFIRCNNLTVFNYLGTIEEFNAIDKNSKWNSDIGNYVIYCTDGQIAKDGTVTYYE